MKRERKGKETIKAKEKRKATYWANSDCSVHSLHVCCAARFPLSTRASATQPAITPRTPGLTTVTLSGGSHTSGDVTKFALLG
jgi:hypothetical protein